MTPHLYDHSSWKLVKNHRKYTPYMIYIYMYDNDDVHDDDGDDDDDAEMR